MKKLISIEKTTNNRFINIYKAKFETEKGEILYDIASRRHKIEELAISGNVKADAVRILPYIIKNGKTYVVLIKEFRYPINDYIYSIPAGIIDEDESPAQAAYRELLEEIGGKAKSLKQTTNINYISAGMSDESVICFESEIENLENQHLEIQEDIEVKIVDLDTLDKMLKTENFGAQSIFQLKAFVNNQQLEHLKQENIMLKKLLQKNKINIKE